MGHSITMRLAVWRGAVVSVRQALDRGHRTKEYPRLPRLHAGLAGAGRPRHAPPAPDSPAPGAKSLFLHLHRPGRIVSGRGIALIELALSLFFLLLFLCQISLPLLVLIIRCCQLVTLLVEGKGQASVPCGFPVDELRDLRRLIALGAAKPG